MYNVQCTWITPLSKRSSMLNFHFEILLPFFWIFKLQGHLRSGHINGNGRTKQFSRETRKFKTKKKKNSFVSSPDLNPFSWKTKKKTQKNFFLLLNSMVFPAFPQILENFYKCGIWGSASQFSFWQERGKVLEKFSMTS